MSKAASKALDALYRSHAQRVYRYVYAILGNRADAEDVVQTTFVNALRALERGEWPRKPSNWLIAIAHNVVRQRFRQQQARPTEVELDRELASRDLVNDSGPTMEELVRALQRIPQSQREALVLRELEGRSYDEIARILGRSKSALETLLFRARRSLADELENAVTCERAELDLSRQLDGRLSRRERRRLNDHIAECRSCKRLQETHLRRRRAFGGLAVLPLPSSLMVFGEAPTASAAPGASSVGGTGASTAVGAGATSGGTAGLGGFGFGLGLGAGGLTAAAVATALLVVSGVGSQEGRRQHRSAENAPATSPRSAAANSGPTIVALPPAPTVVEPGPPADRSGSTSLEARTVRDDAAHAHRERSVNPSSRPVPSVPASTDPGEPPSGPERSRANGGAITPTNPPPSSATPGGTSDTMVRQASTPAAATDATAAPATPPRTTATPPGAAEPTAPEAATAPEVTGATTTPSGSAAGHADTHGLGSAAQEIGPGAASAGSWPCEVRESAHAPVISHAGVDPIAPERVEATRSGACRPSIEGNRVPNAQAASHADVIFDDPSVAADDGFSLPRAQPTRPAPADSTSGTGRP